jgi:hypothetical protein
VTGNNRERRGNRKGREGMRGQAKGKGGNERVSKREGKGLGEAQCSRITF